jgi:RsiW-degrading membrane proteinase PrsW (M82 family)
MRRRDPVQRQADGARDLQEVADWEPRSLVDRLVYRVYAASAAVARAAVIALAALILLAQVALGGFGALADPVVGVFVALSVVPALLLAGYIRYADITTDEPLRLLVGTFVLGLLFAGFAGVLNSLLGGVVVGLLGQFVFDLVGSVETTRSVLLAVFFLVVVAPVEEGVKLLAVRLSAYRRPEFDAVVDGAVYGAAAGLGFATIENALYITDVIGPAGGLVTGGAITTVRALAGPGHVIYSALAGYYLGLARFNREYAGPLVLKGLLVAALAHALYNILATELPEVLAAASGLSTFGAFVAFVVVYDGLLVLVLLRKLSRYRAAYRATRPRDTYASELTEFDP